MVNHEVFKSFSLILKFYSNTNKTTKSLTLSSLKQKKEKNFCKNNLIFSFILLTK